MKIREDYPKENSIDDFGQKPEVDITEIFMDLQENYRNVFIHQFDGEVFMYRSLGRSEYKKILSETELTDFAKEELICQVCTLYPANYDFDKCDAGLPTVYTQKILRNSFLDKAESRKGVLNYYREEMYDLDNQITCIINEAFPQIDIEEIEQWDMEKTTKYLSRAEWKLHNLRGLQFVESDTSRETLYNDEPAAESPNEQSEQKPKSSAREEQTMRGGKKEKLTPDKLRQLQAQFPEIDWTADTIANEGVEGMVDSVDTVSPALRPGS